MSTNTPSQDIQLGRHALIAEAFEMLARHLGPFIDQEMHEHFADESSWLEAASNRLGRPSEHGTTDPLFQLLVLRRFWGPVFAHHFRVDLRNLIGELIDTRNQWAHFNLTSDSQQLRSTILAMERLTAPIAPEATGPLRHLRSRVENPNYVGTSNVLSSSTTGDSADQLDGGDNGASSTESPASLSEEAEIPGVDASTAVDVEKLELQLSETEGVFEQLQDQYDGLLGELSEERKIAADKQLRLASLQRQVIEIETRVLAAQTVLAQERSSRDRIEWLFVGLLAALLLFMVLLKGV